MHDIGCHKDKQPHRIVHVDVLVHQLAVRGLAQAWFVCIGADVGEGAVRRACKALAADVVARHAFVARTSMFSEN